MSGVHDENMKTIEEVIEYIRMQLDRDANFHYENFIFKANYHGQTPAEKYADIYGQYELDLINRLQEMLD